MGRLRTLLGSLKRQARGGLGSFVLEDGSRFYFNPGSPEVFLHSVACLRAQGEAQPFPEPPPIFSAIARAKDRRAALDAVFDGGDMSDILPYDLEALLRRGELVPQSMVAGRELGEPLEDLSE